MNDKVLSLLGLARKAGKIALGFDPAVESVKNGQSQLILISSDISPKSRKELLFSLRDTEIQTLDVRYDAQEIGFALGKSAKIVSVNDAGFAQSVKKLLGSTFGEESD